MIELKVNGHPRKFDGDGDEDKGASGCEQSTEGDERQDDVLPAQARQQPIGGDVAIRVCGEGVCERSLVLYVPQQ